MTRYNVGLALKCGLLLTLIVLTNQGVAERLRVMLSDQRLLSLAIFSLIWLVSLAAALAAAFQPRLFVRLLWAIPLASSSAAAYGYYLVQGSEFYIFDMLNFWAARHEMQRASEFYSDAVWSSLSVFALGIVAIAMPPAIGLWRMRITRYWSPWLPMLPVLLIGGVVIARDGKGSQGMPMQFAPLSLVAVAAYKINTGVYEERHAVSMTPGPPLARAVVLVVDESIRSDFVSLKPGNSLTPELATLRDRLIDFSPAVSSGNCSHLSNALLRFMVDRRNLVRSVHTSPTVWQYAKKAGFRTVFIDAQPRSHFDAVNGKLQNYMTPAEAILIDRFYKFDGTLPLHAVDDELVRIALEEMSGGDPVFIYANKNGAHFPYSDGSPEGLPSNQAAGADTRGFTAELQSYAKAVRWSTDRPISRLIRDADGSDVTIIYTSDHGQNFSPGRLTHCTTSGNVDPQEAIVPLMVVSGNAKLQDRFQEVADRYRGRASHFAIAPTLLELMGYKPSEIATRYEGSLLGSLAWKPQFVSDDIFGLFSTRPAWHQADPSLQAQYGSLDDLLSELADTSPAICGDSASCEAAILH